ncbi:glycoside hydrolase [Catenovulum agarivorans DS-2]|uniref:Glycoside hydrolase n=1 Tax=Catenovulum agarivorans DS-2 TaxID=1328313 RepID=W7QQM3_9ALTE|nr:glycoside hydrolase family 2 [Catenovulum agarivorans]EWH10188.1 glycoside hydrolase [Catenovulum agarivorans DS-2]
MIKLLQKLKLVLSITSIILLSACSLTTKPSAPSATAAQSNHNNQHYSEKVSLAGQWQFQIDPYKKADKQHWWKTTTNTQNWDKIAVPGVWDVYDKYADYMGDAWYRTEFKGDAKWQQQQVRLVFDSVYNDSEVWLNDVYLGANKLGFMAFEFDISKHLNTQGSNTLIVKVNNRFRRGAVWNWGGIRRPVYLEVRPQTHIEKVYVTAQPNLAEGSANIKLETFIANLSDEKINAKVEHKLLRKGQVVAIYNDTPTVTMAANNQTKLTASYQLAPNKVALWHFNNPNLYHIETTLSINNQIVHQHKDRFGIRTVEVKDRKLFLNGEQVRLVGLNMVPEDRFDGNALPLSRIKEDVDLLKSLNANFARLSGPALPKEYLDYLDEVGFLVVEEVALWGKDALVDPDHPLPKQWLERLVSDNYNHPSVIARSVGNEIGDLNKNPKVLEYVEGAIAHAKELDPTRLAVYISYSADYQKNDPSKFSEIVMFNKYGKHEERLQVVDSYHPDKPIFFSEIGTALDGVDPNESVLDVEALMGPLRKYPYLIGTSHFAFSDYRSTWYDEKPSWTTDFSQNRAWGVLTSYRNKKRSFVKLQNFYSPLEKFDLDTSGKLPKIKLKSRALNSFPAYTMQGYRLIWQALNRIGETIQIGQLPIATLTPGQNAPAFVVPYSGDYAKLQVSLIDSAGYIAQQISHDKQVPLSSEIKAHFTSLDTIRVIYERSALANEYQLVAIAPDGTQIKGKSTINHFAEVSGLQPQTEYELHLYAINDAGRGQANSQPLKVHTAPNELPPIIWATEGKLDAFHIGFSVGRNDFAFEVQYGLNSGEYTHKHLVQTKGATRIPAIEQGKDHYFKFRRLITGTVDSDWSEEHKVVLQSASGLQPPSDAVAIATAKGYVVKLPPVRGATGYRLTAKNAKGEKFELDTKLAYSNFINLEDPRLVQATSVQIATLDAQQHAGEFASVELVSQTVTLASNSSK